MMVIPAVDLMDGKCVQLVEGKPQLIQIAIDDPVGMALRWEETGAKRLHVIDLDSALGRGDNTPIIREMLTRLDIPVQVGGGIRDDARAEQLFSDGASQIIVGTRAVSDLEWLQSLVARFPERVIIAVDARGRDISVKGWTNSSGRDLFDYVRSIEDLQLFGLLYTNISLEGKLGGIDVSPINELVKITKKRLFVAGGISSLDDIEKIKSTGARGAVLGMSIYKGKIDLKEALERFR